VISHSRAASRSVTRNRPSGRTSTAQGSSSPVSSGVICIGPAEVSTTVAASGPGKRPRTVTRAKRIGSSALAMAQLCRRMAASSSMARPKGDAREGAAAFRNPFSGPCHTLSFCFGPH